MGENWKKTMEMKSERVIKGCYNDEAYYLWLETTHKCCVYEAESGTYEIEKKWVERYIFREWEDFEYLNHFSFSRFYIWRVWKENQIILLFKLKK